MWYWNQGMSWWMIFGTLWAILLLGGVIGLVVWGIKKVVERNEPGVNQKMSPLDIAKERYARGEISREQFEQIRQDLS